ncbi:hypothetical protein ANANG_G00081300 [Anguilla anguilla]|uniref:Uncharacterized protein n=1 Tax=Anguilla anguilla TaxID=7936 RepID=A0A9D3MN41_ANGAN|nr:hypothetical protein ANANG_G00081300 [Anguilla anguilla]
MHISNPFWNCKTTDITDVWLSPLQKITWTGAKLHILCHRLNKNNQEQTHHLFENSEDHPSWNRPCLLPFSFHFPSRIFPFYFHDVFLVSDPLSASCCHSNCDILFTAVEF